MTDERQGGVRRGLEGLAGAAIGGVLGFFLTVAIFVAEARVGRYVYSLDDVTAFRWEMAPTMIGILLGGNLAWGRLRAFSRGVALAIAVAVVAVPIGWFVGPWLWDGRSAPWAGAVLAAAMGLLIGLGVAIMRGYPLKEEWA